MMSAMVVEPASLIDPVSPLLSVYAISSGELFISTPMPSFNALKIQDCPRGKRCPIQWRNSRSVLMPDSPKEAAVLPELTSCTLRLEVGLAGVVGQNYVVAGNRGRDLSQCRYC